MNAAIALLRLQFYSLGSKHLNTHLMPFWLRCSPCTIDYDVIGKVETLDDDIGYIYGALGLKAMLPF